MTVQETDIKNTSNMTMQAAQSEALPYDVQLQWLQGDGNAYIQTETYGSDDLDFEVEYIPYSPSTYRNAMTVFGSRNDWNANPYQLSEYKVQDLKSWQCCDSCRWDNLLSDSSASARDYVQNGLLVMWDAIENAGFGQHSSDATIWKDLAGRYDLTVNSKIASFTDDCLVVHTQPTSDSFTNAPAYHNTLTLPASEDLEFEVVYSVNRDYDDNFSCNIFIGGGASNVDTTRSRNIVLVQYLPQYGRHFTASSTSVKMLPYNNESTTLTAGRHSYSSGAIRTRPLFDGVEVTGNSAFDAHALSVRNIKLAVGGVKYLSISVLPIGCGMCNVRVHQRHLSLEERMKNFEIDKARFGI